MGEARSFLQKKIQEWNLDADLVARVELAVEEVLVNISRYAYPNHTGDVEVHCRRGDKGQLHLEIHDWGIPYNPLERDRPDPAQDLASRRVGGWGVELMRRMVDELKYSHAQGKNILSLTFRSQDADRRFVSEPGKAGSRSMQSDE
jgi:sigma-B regulation protein RsbU (phosphoserine phosphatase)